MKPSKKFYIDPAEQKVAIQIVALSVTIIVIVLTLLSCIRIYSNKKASVEKDMQTEASLIETVITDHLNYSKYLISIITPHIRNNPKDLNLISNLLEDHSNSSEFNLLFGWRKYSWVNSDFLEIVTSTQGIVSSPRELEFLKDYVTQQKLDTRDEIVFYNSQRKSKGSSLKIINNVFDNIMEYIGSIILSYDINTMIQHLNKRKRNNNINFVILTEDQQVVAQSKNSIPNVINSDAELYINLKNVLEEIDINDQETISYLDMVRGVNYFITPLKGLPFIIIVNIDNNVIKNNIIDNLTKKIIEVCVVAFSCLFIVISIYKRETFFREEAEKATIIANNATKAKTDFLAFTAHEIRSPLGFILTGSEMMTQELMGKLSKKYKEYADGIHNNAKLILDFITDILDENQILENKFKIINTSNNIKAIINESIINNKTRYNKRNINITLKIENNLPLLICDKRRIVQVMNNLISNSIKYSKDDTTIQIIVNMVNHNDTLQIRIIDQGIGMSEEEMPVAFRAYGTVHGAEHNIPGSYGLGLAIVKMLLDAHNAKISLKSKKNKGTEVTITFSKDKLIYDKA